MAARDGELYPVIGREREVERVMQVLSRHEDHSPMIIGQPGVGKTSVVYGLAHRIARVEAPHNITNKRVYKMDAAAIALAAVSPSVTEQWIEQIALERGNAREAILFFDDLHTATELAMIRQLLTPKGVQIIGAITSAEHGQIRYPALARVVTTVPVAEPTIMETIRILDSFRERLQGYHRVTIDVALLPAIAEISARQITARRLPAKAIDLLDEAASLASVRHRSDVDVELAIEALARMPHPTRFH
jgi:ATP-dependent Clp protease ATP-binding subunit ClpC